MYRTPSRQDKLETSTEKSACLHCGREIPAGLTSYCCAGCATVHALLLKRGLGHFYDLRDRQSFGPPRPVPTNEAPPAAVPEALTSARFFIEGIHCLGCLWLLEKLPEIDARIESATLDFPHGILELRRSTSIPWDEVTALIRELGYEPRPLADDEGSADRRAELIRQAIRLGVAGFCAGNIMLLAVSVYAGAEGAVARNFQLLSGLLSLPALLFSAYPLYRSAWIPLRHGRASVDLAVSLALAAGLGLSVFNLARGNGRETYFDSLTMLVFLLLASRFLLNRFRESLAREVPCLSFLSQQRYVRLGPQPGILAAGELKTGDRIVVRPGQTLPADSKLASREAYLDASLLTGESAPLKQLRGDTVEAGVRPITPQTEFEVLRPARESRLARILDQLHAFRLTRSPSLDFADRIGRRFVLVVLGAAVLLGVLVPFPEGLHRAFVLVIVTCPCVLAFAVPLAFTRTLQRAARSGILFRGADKLEELAGARTAFLDKTGTLTNGDFEVLRWTQLSGDEMGTKAAVLSLEMRSSHPVAKALARFLSRVPLPVLEPTDCQEIPGAGIRGRFGSEIWEVLSASKAEDAENIVGIFRDGVLQARAALGDQLRPEAVQFVAGLRRAGLEPVVLSGDTETRVKTVANAVGITQWRARLTPEKKAELVRSTPRSLMIGDGANDAIAFQAASVGIAVRGAMELSLRNADVALASPGLDSALAAIHGARRAMRVVRTNFGISLAYNVLAGTIAASGAMSPLLAAVLMPISALSVFAFTQLGTREVKA